MDSLSSALGTILTLFKRLFNNEKVKIMQSKYLHKKGITKKHRGNNETEK